MEIQIDPLPSIKFFIIVDMQQEQTENLFVVGAGFSKGLGYPLTTELLPNLYPRLNSDLKNIFNKVVEFHHPHWDGRAATLPNIEQLLTEWSANEELLRSIRPNGNFRLQDIKHLREQLLRAIVTWFHEIHDNPKRGREQIIDQFKTHHLDKLYRVAIISFNWDYELDRSLFSTKKNSAGLRQYHYGLNEGGPLQDLAILKPHGSLNWFPSSPGQYLTKKKRLQLWGANNAKDSMYCFLRWREPVSQHDREYVPYIVPPTHWKSFEHPMMRFIWKRCVDAVSTAKTIYFLGYSLPLADWHARYIFRCGFHNQADGFPLPKRKRDPSTKHRARVIVVNPDNEAFRRIENAAGFKCEWVPSTVVEWLDDSKSHR